MKLDEGDKIRRMADVRPIRDPAAEAAAAGLYEGLRGNDFKQVEDGMKALGERMEVSAVVGPPSEAGS